MSPELRNAVAVYRNAREAERELFRAMTRDYRAGHPASHDQSQAYWHLRTEATRLRVAAQDLFAREYLDAGL